MERLMVLCEGGLVLLYDVLTELEDWTEDFHASRPVDSQLKVREQLKELLDDSDSDDAEEQVRCAEMQAIVNQVLGKQLSPTHR